MDDLGEQASDFFDEHQDSILFFLTYILGLSFLVIGRITFDSLSAFALSFILIILMSGYAFLVGGTRRFRITAESAADNAYFLGFMFTITSLAVSLYRYSESSTPETNIVIADLSVGLATTLWGLLLRIWFSQSGWNPDGVQEKIRMDLLAAAEKSRTDIQATSDLISQSRVLIQQTVDEARETVKNSGSALARNVQSLTAKVERVEVPEDLVTGKLTPALELMSESVNEFSLKIESVDLPKELISERVDDFFNSLNRSAENGVDLLANQISAHARLKLGEGIEEVTKEFSVLVGNLEVSPDLLESRLTPLADELSNQFLAFNDSIAVASVNFQEELAKIASTFGELTDSQSDLREQLTKIKGHVEAASSTFENLSSETGAHTNLLTASLEQAVGSFSQKVADLNDLSAVDFSAVDSVRDSTSLVAQAATEMAAKLSSLNPAIDALNDRTSRLVQVIDGAVVALDRFEGAQAETKDGDSFAGTRE